MRTASAGTLPWYRAYGILLAGLLSALSVGAAAYAASAMLSQAYDGRDMVCGSAWRFHPGSGTTMTGSGRTAAQNAAFVERCNSSGAADWQRGVTWAWVGGGAGAASLVVLVTLAVVPLPSRRRPRVVPRPLEDTPAATQAAA